jgi:hypothetical protein
MVRLASRSVNATNGLDCEHGDQQFDSAAETTWMRPEDETQAVEIWLELD